jgi:RNA 2',3'-cyclic 3'-phosphodiesterase
LFLFRDDIGCKSDQGRRPVVSRGLPDPETAARIYRMAEVLKKANAFRGQLTSRERLHVSLFCFNGLDKQSVERACGIVGQARTEPFTLGFDRNMSFRGQAGSCPFVLTGSDGLRSLSLFRRSLANTFARKDGLRHLELRDFTPHVTLLFDDQSADEQPFGPVEWIARELVLIHSDRGHAHLARWPLHV